MSEADGLQKEIFGQKQTHNLFQDQIRGSQNKFHMECKRAWPFADVDQHCQVPCAMDTIAISWDLDDAVAEINFFLSSLGSWCALSA